MPSGMAVRHAVGHGDEPRLQIDKDGTAEVVFPPPRKKPRLMTDNNGSPRLLIDKIGVARDVVPDKNKLKDQKAFNIGGIGTGIHLRIGRHPESFLRTKLPEPVEENPMTDIVPVSDDETIDEPFEEDIVAPVAASVPQGHVRCLEAANTEDDVDSLVAAGRAAFASGIEKAREGIAGIHAASEFDLSYPEEGGITYYESRGLQFPKPPWMNIRADLQSVRLPPGMESARLPPIQPDLEWHKEQGHRRKELYHQDVLRSGVPDFPILPPVVFIKQADAYTRLRHTADILIMNGEKYLRLDETHFLYAINDVNLMSGENTTIRRNRYDDWNADRYGGRPAVLFELYPKGEHAYSPETDRRKKAPQGFRPRVDSYGRIILNADDRPLKFSNVMPARVSTNIEGWEMEAICRLDPNICHQDFIDRMLGQEGLGAKPRPNKGTLNHRRRRDRIKMRVLPWPLPAELSYSDKQVVNDLTAVQLKKNTTVGLEDLSKDDMEIQEAVMYGGHFERSGAGKALNDQTRLEQLKVNLALLKTRFAESSEEVKAIRDRIAQLIRKYR